MIANKHIGKYKNAFLISTNTKFYVINMRNRKYWSVSQIEIKDKEQLLALIEKEEEMLVYNGIIEEPLENHEYTYVDYAYQPIMGTFLLSSICNLQCSYCYAYNNHNKMLELEKSKLAVDYLIENAIKKNCETIILKFHGIGEPTLNFEVLKSAVAYAKVAAAKQNLTVKAGITTNGVCTDQVREWMNENLDSITISFDGFKSIQNI